MLARLVEVVLPPRATTQPRFYRGRHRAGRLRRIHVTTAP
jgi:hypothetical protein